MKFNRLIYSLAIILSSVLPCNAQKNAVDSLMRFAGNIHQFNSIYPQEKVYLQFDNTSYYTGETIWFKAFVVNASNLDRTKSRILYVELLSPTGTLLQRDKYMIVAGQADGSITLIDAATSQAREKRGMTNYPSGFYEIRAYTSYMQNFPDDIIFSRVIAVYEKPDAEGGYYEQSPAIKLHSNDISQLRPETGKLKPVTAEFFPEGGHLIMGKPNRIAFKVTNENGFGIDATGSVSGTDITFSTAHDGMGSFMLTPDKAQNSVSISVDGRSHSFQLPRAEKSGCQLTLTQPGKDKLELTIHPTEDLAGKTLGLTLTCRGELMDFTTVKTGRNARTSEEKIDLNGIPEGVCRVTLFTADGAILATRSFYHRSQTQVVPQLTVTTDKPKYDHFEKIELSLNLTDGNGNPFRDRFCLSVRDSRSPKSVFSDDLRTALLLSSDLKGLIEDPEYYFEESDQEHNDALDLLMLVQGWERYDWQTMTGQKEFQEVHRLETGLTLNGWILNPAGKKPMAGVQVLGALMPKDKTKVETYTYITDSTGYFGFDIGVDFYDKAKFTIDARPERERLIGTSARIKFDRSISPEVRAYLPAETVSSAYGTRRRSKKGAAGNDSEENLYPTIIDEHKGLLLPDVDVEEGRLYVDYFTFSAYDVQKDVELDLDKGEFSNDVAGYLLDKGYQVLFGDSGGIELINGYEPFFYVHNETKIRNKGIFEEPSFIDSKDIKSILVYDKVMYYMNALDLAPLYMEYLSSILEDPTGDERLYNRVMMVDIQVKEDHLLSTRNDIYKINKRITSVDGYARTYQFYSPEYPTGPILGDVDYRRTLYWDPNVITDAEGNAKIEFYNNSQSSTFNVSGAGITASGVPYTLDVDF